MLLEARSSEGDRPSPITGPQALSPAGLRILIPGYAQWSWRQRERGLVLFGSYLVAVGVAVFAWGTWTGLLILAFAFGTHVVSAVDVIRQGSFPGFGRWMPLVSASGGLAVGVYSPVLGVATLLAWPAIFDSTTPEGYAVNRWAYRARPPVQGDWVWLRTSPLGEPRIGRVLAGAGQEVEWSGERLRVAGEPQSPGAFTGSPFRSSWTPEELAYTVPVGHVLVSLEASRRPDSGPGGSVLVPDDQVIGRAWARLYPIRDRQLLR